MKVKRFLLTLIVLFFLGLLTSCGCKHEWKDATCTKPQTCTKCGKTEGEALGHMYGKEKVLKESSCTETGSKELTCSICGEVETVEIPATGHKLKFISQEKAPTCSEKGKGAYRCTVCGEIKYEEIAKLPHQYKDGYCTVCFAEDPEGVSFNPSSDDKKKIKTIETMSNIEIKEEKDFYYLLFAFYDANSNTVIAPCIVDIRIENSKKETVYKAKRIVEISNYCKWSNAFKESILASPKIMLSDIKEGFSSWGTLYITVKFVNSYFEETAQSIYNLPTHSLGNKEVVKEATCVTDGLARGICSSCGQIVEETIPATGVHAYIKEIVKNATCSTFGLDRKTCSVCGKVVEDIVAATGEHTYIEEILQNATCAVGIVKKTCSSCGYVVVEAIPATSEHVYLEEIENATCGKDGVIRKTCKVCGKVDEEIIPATGKHTYRNSIVVSEPTCISEGILSITCSVCGIEGWTEKLDKLVHPFTNDKCLSCGTLRIGSRGPAGGFVFYDCDLDNAEGNSDNLISSECGWRFLEAAPEDVGKMVFGYCRNSANGKNLYVNGDVEYYEGNCTRRKIGYGKSNTDLLVEAMGDETYSKESGSEKTEVYAAKACVNYSLNGYDDWFLPSEAELNLMYTNLKKNGFGNFYSSSYWSSSENSVNYAWLQYFHNGSQSSYGRDNSYYVRPIRAF